MKYTNALNGQIEESFNDKSRGVYNRWAIRFKNMLISHALGGLGFVEYILQKLHVENVIINAIIFGKRNGQCKVS
jgi:hypothetical protein